MKSKFMLAASLVGALSIASLAPAFADQQSSDSATANLGAFISGSVGVSIQGDSNLEANLLDADVTALNAGSTLADRFNIKVSSVNNQTDLTKVVALGNGASPNTVDLSGPGGRKLISVFTLNAATPAFTTYGDIFDQTNGYQYTGTTPGKFSLFGNLTKDSNPATLPAGNYAGSMTFTATAL
jgi:hypothetical protein